MIVSLLTRLAVALALVLGAPLMVSSGAMAKSDHMAVAQSCAGCIAPDAGNPCDACHKASAVFGACIMTACIAAVDLVAVPTVHAPAVGAAWTADDQASRGRTPEPALTPPRS